MKRNNQRQKFGDAGNSIRNTLQLPDSDPAIATLFYKNAREYNRQTAELEMWASMGFISGYSVTDYGRGDQA
jgi:hypothetical protein